MDDQPNMATGSNMTAKGSVSLKNSLEHIYRSSYSTTRWNLSNSKVMGVFIYHRGFEVRKFIN